MQSSTAGTLLDLRAAAETVRKYQVFGRGGAHCWKKHALADFHRDLVVAPFEPERSCHAAASGVQNFEFKASSGQQLAIRIEAQDRFVMTVRLHNGLAAFKIRRFI